MKRLLHYISGILVTLVVFVSCGKGGAVIPESKMAEIYAELFMADYWLEIHEPESGLQFDTSLVYEPVFEKYGYTSDEYRTSMAFYISDTDKYARILKETTLILEARLKELQKEKARQDDLEQMKKESRQDIDVHICFLSGLYNNDIYCQGDSLCFFVDTTASRWDFDPQKGCRKAYYGPEIRICSDLTR